MLLGQAYALQSIFTNLSRLAAKQEHLKHYEVFLKLGLKAQSQCRATLETLTIMSNAWNPERRMRQAMLIQTWKPWRRATGPITDTGKRQSSRNAYKGNDRHQMRATLQRLKQLMKQQESIILELST